MICLAERKPRTRGYGSLDYELIGYRPSKLVKLDILLNGDIVDALSFILFAENAYPRARKICEKLKEVNKGNDIAAIKAATEDVQKAFYAVSEKMYQQANPQGAQGCDPNCGGNCGGDGVVDADYETVD